MLELFEEGTQIICIMICRVHKSGFCNFNDDVTLGWHLLSGMRQMFVQVYPDARPTISRSWFHNNFCLQSLCIFLFYQVNVLQGHYRFNIKGNNVRWIPPQAGNLELLGGKYPLQTQTFQKFPDLFPLHFQKSPLHLNSLLTLSNITITDSPCVCTTLADIIFSIFYYSY